MRRRTLEAVLATVVMMAGCTRAGAPEPEASRIRGAGSGSSPPPAGPAYARTCDSAVLGDLGARWKRDAIVAGPIAFVGLPGYADDAATRFRPHDGAYWSQKVLVVVTGAAPVTVAISSEDRANVSLLYDPAAFKDTNFYRISDGVPVVTFEACGDRAPTTQYNGAFLVAGTRCATLDVSVPHEPPKKLTVPFGMGTCSVS